MQTMPSSPSPKEGAVGGMFVLFSSVAAPLGAVGQANHSAVNAFEDAFAHYRVSQGQMALSVQWGAWGTVGAASALGARLESSGVLLFPPQAGVDALELLLQQRASTRVMSCEVACASIDWAAYH
jgi:hypothetical protein